MTLLELAKMQMKRVQSLLGTVQGSKPAGAVFENLGVPLLQYTIGKEKPLEDGESRSFQGVDIPVAKGADGLVDIEHVRGSVNDFVNSVILFAHNPIRRLQHGTGAEPNVSIDSPRDKLDEYTLRFKKLGPEKYDAKSVFEAIDKLEEGMFSDWREKKPKSKELTKVFPTAEDANRTTHLLMCLANAVGFTDASISGAFRAAPNDHTLVVHEDFIKALAAVERSEVASIGRARYGT